MVCSSSLIRFLLHLLAALCANLTVYPITTCRGWLHLGKRDNLKVGKEVNLRPTIESVNQNLGLRCQREITALQGQWDTECTGTCLNNVAIPFKGHCQCVWALSVTHQYNYGDRQHWVPCQRHAPLVSTGKGRKLFCRLPLITPYMFRYIVVVIDNGTLRPKTSGT